jgi:DNA-binding transcriptional ArsR family regulator
MRTACGEYAFSKSEIRILKELAKGKHSLRQIEEALSIKPSLLSYNLRRLLNKGIVRVAGNGFRKYVCFDDSKHASRLRDLLLVYDYIDWQNILAGKAVEILFQTVTGSRGSLEEFPRATLWRHVRNLKAHGILIQEESRYKINPRFSILIGFLNEYRRFMTEAITHSISESAVILWQEGLEFLIRAPKGVKAVPKNSLKTATSLFSDFGIPIFSEFDIYFYSEEKKSIRLEDATVHTLLIEPNNVRYAIYALLLLEKYGGKIDREYLSKQARRFGLDRQVSGMLQFLKTHIPMKDLALPTWQEFEEKARDYKVIA